MNEYNYEEMLASAEAAFANKQYQASLDYYRKALEEQPDNVYVLSRAGSLCIVLGLYDEAIKHFIHAAEVDPNNGDNYYNLGNAYFFMKEYAGCLDMYTKAENMGCSEEVLNKIFFQKAMLCSARGDMKSALVYLKKYEAAVADNIKSIDPRVLTEKLKIQTVLNQYEEAELTAAKLLNIQPTKFQNYVLYFNLLMLLKKYDKAESIMFEAQECADMNDKEKYALAIQKAAFYTEMIDVFSDNEEAVERSEKLALMIFDELLSSDNPEINKNEVAINRANFFMKAKKYDEAIELLKKYLPATDIIHCDADLTPIPEESDITSDTDDTDTSGQYETEDNGGYYGDDETSGGYYDYDGGESSDGYYDDGGESHDNYADEDEVSAQEKNEEEPAEEDVVEEKTDVSEEFIERVRYILMSCYISKEDYLNALNMSEYLKESQNMYYQYFSRYCEAYAYRNLAGSDPYYTKELGERKYAEAIAFYRSKMMSNPKDRYAIVLRTRMYAEQGSYAKAEEMTNLLTAEESSSLKEYIEKCRNSDKTEA